MRDITPYQPETPRPSRPPSPRPPAPSGRRRRLLALALVGLLVVATIAATAGTIVASFRGAGGISFDTTAFSSLATTLSDAYRRLKGSATGSFRLISLGTDFMELVPSLLKGERGGDFLALLARAEQELLAFDDQSLVSGLFGRASDLAKAVGDLRAWLSGAEERRVAVVFGNSAEMRAGGGFIGSYAEVVLRGGAVSGITVRDIVDADSGSGDRTIPPAPLEPVTDRWRAADANWFLSGPASGATFLDLLNRSPLYAEDKVDAVVFVAPRVVSELLAISGPVTADGVEVNADSFLRVIQNEVQEGQASGAESPKAVLAALVPSFMNSLIDQAAGSPVALFSALEGGVARRDIVAYAGDTSLQRSIETLGIAGSLYPTPAGFVGTYVAVAPSTIGGDKTDAVTSEAVAVREQLLPDGLIETAVSVERTHGGKDSDPWWYQEEHRSYVKVYAPPGAEPTALSGSWVRERDRAVFDGSFTAHPSLRESTVTLRSYNTLPGLDAFSETGKQAFGFWQRTARGSGTVASVTYARQLERALQAGDTYLFVMERQPASTATYAVELFAPPGLIWKDTGTSRWTFDSEDPAGRTVVPLTLVNPR